MNRRLEDEIAKMAFGDMDPRRTAEIERLAETDPEVRKALSQYRAMREGLQAMAPSVEHQLSSERLRDEILRRGLSPKRRAGTSSCSEAVAWLTPTPRILALEPTTLRSRSVSM